MASNTTTTTTTATTTLAAEIKAVVDNFQANAPENLKTIINTTKTDHENSFNYEGVIRVGDKLPEFILSNHLGEKVNSRDILAKGPMLLTFYRGNWCPFCNLELRSLQRHLPEFTAAGCTLVAVSPELPDEALTTQQKHDLAFPVLSDVGNAYARQLGLVWQQPDTMRTVFAAHGTDFTQRNGDDSLEVPVPATFLVAGDGTVRNAFVQADWTVRLETAEAVEWVKALGA